MALINTTLAMGAKREALGKMSARPLDLMKSKKSSGKGKTSGKRAVKDLAARKTQPVKGGGSSLQKKYDDTVAAQQAKIG